MQLTAIVRQCYQHSHQRSFHHGYQRPLPLMTAHTIETVSPASENLRPDGNVDMAGHRIIARFLPHDHCHPFRPEPRGSAK
jgi:hypothetical protein